MKISINAQGAERKRLVKIIAAWTGYEARYCGAPTFSYDVGGITIDKDAGVDFGGVLPDEAIDRLLQHICEEGFDVMQFFTDSDDQEDDLPAVTISMPRDLFTDEAITNLYSILVAKKTLICKAIGCTSLPVNVTDDKVSFPWFDEIPAPEQLEAYETFICKVCDMAKNQKRINAKEKPADNEKYAFRCFLLRLGFIGDEYKAARKILLRNFSGSSAFKSGQRKEAE